MTDSYDFDGPAIDPPTEDPRRLRSKFILPRASIAAALHVRADQQHAVPEARGRRRRDRPGDGQSLGSARPEVIEKLIEAAQDPRNHGYSKSNGLLNLRREVASKYFRKYGVRLDPEQEVIACLGSKEGFSHMCLALMGPGDTAMIPSPYFPIHMYGVILASGNVVALDVADPDKFLSNVAYTCENLTPRPKVLIVNYPHNPSTATIEPDFFVEVVRLAKQVWLHGDPRFRLRRRRLRRLPAAELSWPPRGPRTWASNSRR